MLNISGIHEGFVLDHIQAGMSLQIYHDLKLDQLDCPVAIIKNAKSSKMGKKIRTEEVDHLFEAILCLKNKEECYTFFEDVCTINELLSLSQRFEVAKMLTDKRTYLDISEKTGASTATISRVNRSLNYGNDGYEMVFERMKAKENKTEE